jgi:hypothetical protein
VGADGTKPYCDLKKDGKSGAACYKKNQKKPGMHFRDKVFDGPRILLSQSFATKTSLAHTMKAATATILAWIRSVPRLRFLSRRSPRLNIPSRRRTKAKIELWDFDEDINTHGKERYEADASL